MLETLIESKIFQGLDIEQLKNALDGILYKIKKYRKGELMYQSGETIDELIILLKGKVSTEMMSFSGKSINISIMKAPEPIADAIMFSSKSQLPVNVEAIEEVEILVISKKELFKLFAKQSIILENYLQSIADRAVLLTQKIFLLSLKTIKGKIAVYLMRQAKGRTEFEIRHTQKELSSLFGIARPSLAREMKQMMEEGIIEVDRRHIKIINIKALKELVE